MATAARLPGRPYDLTRRRCRFMDATPNCPGTRVPPPHADHPLVDGRYIFTLPKELLEDAVAAVGEERFDPPLLDLERALSAACGDHSEVVGFRAGVPVRYGLLGRPPGLATTAQGVTDAMSKELGWAVTPAVLAALGVIDERVERARDVCRAYNGWLALNPQFADEQAAFFARWGAMARRVGLDAPTPGAEDRARQSMADYAAFADHRDRLLRRWELAGLAGPFLPDPPRPHAPLAGGVDAVLPDPRLGTTFFFPRIFPLPDRQELSRMVDDAMARHRLPPHLKGWSDLIATDNPAAARRCRASAASSCSSTTGGRCSSATPQPCRGTSEASTRCSPPSSSPTPIPTTGRCSPARSPSAST